MSDIRRFIDIVTLREDAFNQLAYFRALSDLSITARKRNNPAVIDSMFKLIGQGKLAAANMPKDQQVPFLKKVQRVSDVSAATLGLDPSSASAGSISASDEITSDDRGQSDTLTKQNYYGGDPKAAQQGRLIRLAYAAGPEKKVLGISVQGQKYTLFHGVAGQNYKVISAPSLEAAQQMFARGISRGYTEISPGGYAELIQSANRTTASAGNPA